MRIAFFSPLPPEPTGIGDYSFELLEELRELVDVTAVVADNRRAAARAPEGVEIIGVSSARADDFDANVYQMGNNPKYHRFVFHNALEEPGLLVMHDPSLADYLAELCGGAQSSIFRDEVSYDSPDIGPDDDLPLVDVGDGTKNLDRLRVLLARRIVGASVRTLVNSEAMAIEMRRRYPGNDIHAIQLPGRAVGSPDGEDSRRGSSPIRFGVFGGINYYKRIRPTVDAFIEFRRGFPDAQMVIAGRADDRLLTAEIRRLAAREELAGSLQVKTDLTLEELEREMTGCDVAISLRWPTAGEMSATLMRCLGAGRPAVVSDVLQFRELDDRYCWRVPVAPPEAEAAALQKIMETAALDPERCREVGAAARDFVAREANYTAVARRYVDHLEECIADLPVARRAQRPRSLDWSTPLGVNVITLDRDGESAEYARRLADALTRAGVDVVEIEIAHHSLPDPSSIEWHRDLDLVAAGEDGLASTNAATDAPDPLTESDQGRNREEPETDRIRVGPHAVDVFVVGEGEVEEFGYLARYVQRRDHAHVAVIAPSWVPLPYECMPLTEGALEIWVPSAAAADAIRVGARTPVSALPPFPSLRTDNDVLPSGATVCTFVVHVDGRESLARQNPWASIAAFRLAFAPSERGRAARLLVVTRHLDPRSEGARRLAFELERAAAESVQVMALADVRAQIATGDVFVSLHRSEGFGTHVLDAMAAARPVIATTFLGVGHYLNARNGCPVGYVMRDADAGDFYLDRRGPALARRGECWADANLDQAARWMRRMAASPTLRDSLGARAALDAEELGRLETDLSARVRDLGQRRLETLERGRGDKEERRRRFAAFIAEFAIGDASIVGA